MRRIGIVDDHDLVGLALRNLVDVAPQLSFARHEHTVPEMTRLARDADLVLLDLSLRDGSTPQDNVDALRRWGAHVLVLTSAENPFLVREASRTAALGIARKSSPSVDLVAALLDASEGRHVPTAEWASALDSDPRLIAAPLTEREREVLSLYASGMGAREVAAALWVTENTVNDHLRRIKGVYQRLGRPAASKVDLYRRGIEDGFLPVPRRD
ncbi:MAG: helix-turn-helix transcriptional regulator [Microbacterium sp. 71-36]|uniref:LuxR C-terminal-related transcriptional regulator n=1 Tax=unclassified Microbacterium TaxID=2609290 RepID=UPI00086EE126|nr:MULTISPECIES: response regulator transcription factor [unclassified Microbacterium]MBN9212456.1 response regulator transcription factor [Microbacterium sp.]ODT36061.1 MAG: helix-turn-helix transcriptional regulator [Microbacterium sp. SCN 71-17]OJV78129.1 MAG: helix-turn-helix transcriptional regulator [Microbacterium sp. 71-36]